MEYTSVAFERSYVFQSFVIVCVLLVIKPTHGTCSRENLSAFCNYLLMIYSEIIYITKPALICFEYRDICLSLAPQISGTCMHFKFEFTSSSLHSHSSCSRRYLNCNEFFILLILNENTKFKITSGFLFF